MDDTTLTLSPAEEGRRQATEIIRACITDKGPLAEIALNTLIGKSWAEAGPTKPLPKWSFDDGHIGTIGKSASSLGSRIISRPGYMAREEWYAWASEQCRYLNSWTLENLRG